MQNLIALLEECLASGDQGQAVLHAWFIGERHVVVSAIAEAEVNMQTARGIAAGEEMFETVKGFFAVVAGPRQIRVCWDWITQSAFKEVKVVWWRIGDPIAESSAIRYASQFSITTKPGETYVVAAQAHFVASPLTGVVGHYSTEWVHGVVKMPQEIGGKMFKRKVTEDEARQKLDDVEMRWALYKQIWDKAHPDPALPCPHLSDKEVQTELRRLLK